MQDELKELGYEIVVVAPDLPAYLRKMRSAHELAATFLSDTSMELATAFGLAFVQTDERYHRLLEESSGEDHHELPVPAVYITDADKQIDFAYTNVVYQIRLPSDVLLAAARSFAPEPQE